MKGRVTLEWRGPSKLSPNRIAHLQRHQAGNRSIQKAHIHVFVEPDQQRFADLDKPSHTPEATAQYFGTTGKCFVAMVNHASFHTGQIADARRAVGREVLMA